MSYDFYKLMHLTGIIMLFLSYGNYLLAALQKQGRKFEGKKIAAALHGIGLTLALVGGFGLAARLQVPVSTGWVLAKIVIWVLLGAMLAPILRRPEWAKAMYFVIILLGMSAAYIARVKPF